MKKNNNITIPFSSIISSSTLSNGMVIFWDAPKKRFDGVYTVNVDIYKSKRHKKPFANSRSLVISTLPVSNEETDNIVPSLMEDLLREERML